MNQIKELKEKGLTNKQIAIELGISEGKVSYWTNPESMRNMKEKSKRYYYSLTIKERKEILSKRKQYMRNYLHNRYHNDESFRLRVRETQRKYLKRIALNKKSNLGLPVPVSKE
jgi:predicted transcriptional regulator